MPIDTSIYNALIRPKSVGDYLAEYDERDLRDQTRQANALALQSGRQKQADYEREQQEYGLVQNVLAGLGAGATDDQRANALYGTGTGYGMKQAEAIRKQMIEQQKAAAEAQAKRAEVASKNAGIVRQLAGVVIQDPRRQTWQAVLAHYQNITNDDTSQVATIFEQAGDNPELIRKIALGFAMEAERALPKTEISDLGGTKQAITTDVFGTTTPGQTFQKTPTPDARVAAGTAAARLAFDRDRLAEDQRQFNAPKPVGGNSRTGPMSVTLQKELLESDDTVQAAAGVVRALEAAKTQNEAAYSGYLAKQRATLASNVVPGGTNAADATIDIDNLMTGQGLESLKAIFGAAPTEGERRILMDMQASVDKTPKQRAAIMDRAIAAAKRRAEYAARKAAAIRDGSYLVDGVPDSTPSGSPAAPAAGGWKIERVN